MGRRIVWSTYEDSGSGQNQSLDGYFDRLLKYIPSDVVGLWIVGSGLINSQATSGERVGLLWLLFVVGLVFSFWWTWQQTKRPHKAPAWQQIGLSTCSFGVWVIALGGPFAELPFYQPLYGSLLLLIYTVAIPRLPAPPPAQQ